MKRLCYSRVAALFFLLSTAMAFADGCYIPPKAVRKMPEIPAQRAVVCWKDGVETLVISSALNSESQKLGWIIPLPSVPDAMEKEMPGGLKTLNFCLQPRIVHISRGRVAFPIIFVIVANLLMVTALFSRNRFWDLVLLLLIVLLLAGLLTPALSTAGGFASPRSTLLQVEKTATVGSYEIAVLRPKKGHELNAWLDGNGFASLPPAADRTVDDYIEAGWVFATVKLTREEAGSNAPHPIRLVFHSQEPVYPLKLTKLAGGNSNFELFVIGNQRASSDRLKTEYCDRFSKLIKEDGRQEGYETKTSYSGMATHAEIGHPSICQLMWDGCVVSKLSGTIPPDMMTSDLELKWSTFEVQQEVYYTEQGALESAWALFIWLTGGWLFISMFMYRKWLVQPRSLLWYGGKVLLPAGVLAAVAAVLFYASVHRLADSEVQVSLRFRPRFYAMLLKGDIELRLHEKPEIMWKTEKEIAAYLQENLGQFNRPTGNTTPPQNRRNLITGGRIVAEDSPGNFTTEGQGPGLVVRAYDATGRPMICLLPEGAEVQPGR